MKKPKPTRGGAREGSGRKKLGRTEAATFKLSPEAIANIAAKSKSKKVSKNQLVDGWARKLRIKEP